MPEPLSWEAIQALNETALNLAIEQWCYDRAWQRCTQRTCHARHYVRVSMGHDLALDPPQHTTSWDRTMVLAWRYSLSIRHMGRTDGSRYWFVGMEGEYGSLPMTEHEARIGLCRAALSRAVQEKDQGVCGSSS